MKAGERLSVTLRFSGESEGVVFSVESVKEEDLPEEVLHIYAGNDELLSQVGEQTKRTMETTRAS